MRAPALVVIAVLALAGCGAESGRPALSRAAQLDHRAGACSDPGLLIALMLKADPRLRSDQAHARFNRYCLNTGRRPPAGRLADVRSPGCRSGVREHPSSNLRRWRARSSPGAPAHCRPTERRGSAA